MKITDSKYRSELDSHRSTPDLPEKQDIIIIGAGFAGAALAYYLLKDTASSKPSITVLEAREACSGATGRNGAYALPLPCVLARGFPESGG